MRETLSRLSEKRALLNSHTAVDKVGSKQLVFPSFCTCLTAFLAVPEKRKKCREPHCLYCLLLRIRLQT
jgi:hypothetical protein